MNIFSRKIITVALVLLAFIGTPHHLSSLSFTVTTTIYRDASTTELVPSEHSFDEEYSSEEDGSGETVQDLKLEVANTSDDLFVSQMHLFVDDGDKEPLDSLSLKDAGIKDGSKVDIIVPDFSADSYVTVIWHTDEMKSDKRYNINISPHHTVGDVKRKLEQVSLFHLDEPITVGKLFYGEVQLDDTKTLESYSIVPSGSTGAQHAPILGMGAPLSGSRLKRHKKNQLSQKENELKLRRALARYYEYKEIKAACEGRLQVKDVVHLFSLLSEIKFYWIWEIDEKALTLPDRRKLDILSRNIDFDLHVLKDTIKDSPALIEGLEVFFKCPENEESIFIFTECLNMLSQRPAPVLTASLKSFIEGYLACAKICLFGDMLLPLGHTRLDEFVNPPAIGENSRLN